jgi:hypothetical protein
MPSKKKSKARKGGKKMKEEGQRQQQGAPEAQMERLKIADDSQADEDALLEEAIKLAAAEKEALDAAADEQKEQNEKIAENHGVVCFHGYVKKKDHFIISDFVRTYVIGCTSNGYGAGALLSERFEAASKATFEKYPEVLYDPSKMKHVVSYFIFMGTKGILNGNVENARAFASTACYFEEHIAVYLHKTKALRDLAKALELRKGDEHTLVKYLRKSIPCKCLDEKYEEVKSITKMGFCWNPQCSIPDRMVVRKSMLYCTRCRQVNYCSAECQKAHWPKHKEFCDEHVGARAGLDSRKYP